MADATEIKYRAFISYSHVDTGRAEWLHKRLETYPLCTLAGQATALGPVPKTLRPIFRDRNDFPAGGTLTQQTIAALDASAALIVLCSPASANSAAVTEEIRLFRWRHPSRSVIPVIASGTPGRGADECFAPALRSAVDGTGSVTDQPETVLGADLRDTGDGEELALAKVVAALIGVPSDEVYRRAERERRRAARIRAAVAATIVALVGTGGYLGWQSRQQAAELTDIAALVDRYAPIGSAQGTAPGARERIASAFESITKGTATDSRYKRALDFIKAGKPQDAEPLLRESAEDEEAAGLQRLKQAAEKYRNLGAIAGYADPKRAREYYTKASKLDPDNLDGLQWHGDMELSANNVDEAERSYHRMIAIGSVGKDDYKLCSALVGLAHIYEYRGNLPKALEAYRQISTFAKLFIQANGVSVDWQRTLAASYMGAGDVQKSMGDTMAALENYRFSLAIKHHIASANPSDLVYLRDLSTVYERIGDWLRLKGNSEGALEMYNLGLDISRRIAESNSKNIKWQQDLAGSYNGIGLVRQAQGEYSKALDSFHDSLLIDEQLIKSDPENAQLKSDLAAAYSGIAEISLQTGNLSDAAQWNAKGAAILESLIRRLPADSTLKRDLAVYRKRMSGIETYSERKLIRSLFDQGDFAGAAATQTKLADTQEQMEIQRFGNAGVQTSLQLGDVSWLKLFTKEFDQAYVAATRALSLDPDNVYAANNRVYALMFLGRNTEAREAYSAQRGKSMPGGNRLCETAILEDLDEFEKRGLRHPQISEIRPLLNPPKPAQR